MPLILQDNVAVSLTVKRNGTTVSAEPALNFIEGSNMNVLVVDNGPLNRIDVTPSLAVTDYSGSVVASSPASYWHLDETSGTVASDATAVVNGTYVASPSLVQAPLISTGGKSVSLGANQGINMGTAAYQFSGTSAFTVEGWLNITSQQAANNAQYFASRFYTGASGTEGWALYVYFASLTTYSLRFSRWHNGTAITAASSDIYNLGETHYVAGSYDSSASRIVVDGVLAGTGATDTRSLTAGTANLMFGNAPTPSATGALYGYLDEPAIYTRSLPVSESNTHYLAGAS